MLRLTNAFAFVLLLFAIAGCVPTEEERLRVAHVTNGVASFWTIAEKGAEAGGLDFNADVDVLMPAEGITQQHQMIEDLLTRGVDGVAVSPIDPVNQTDLLNDAAEETVLITHDSDAPDSNRRCYIGMDNYDAGRMCGELVKEAMPDCGEVMTFIGHLEQDNMVWTGPLVGTPKEAGNIAWRRR